MATFTASQVFGAQVRAVRKRLDLTQADLAERLAEIGLPIDRATVAKIEGGGRKSGVSVDVVLAFAAALNVSPLHLFVPRDEDDQLRITSEIVVGALEARTWVRGFAALPGQSRRIFFSEGPESEFVIPPWSIDQIEHVGIRVTRDPEEDE